MTILIIGGGVFVGRALVEAALAQGHPLTTFSRGNSPLPRATEIESIIGDRNQDLNKLVGRKWDAVIDTCAYRPEEVTSLCQAIGTATGHYTLISSISAYGDPARVGLSETHALSKPLTAPGPEITAKNYGPLKAAAELSAAAFAQTLIIRPGIIAGPYDPTDRMTYWVNLIEQQSHILVPTGLPSCPVQLIDVRDLASWVIAQIERSATGACNAVGPQQPITMGEMFTAIAAGLGKTVTTEERTPDSLTALGANPKTDFPLHIPVESERGGLFQVSGQKSWASGLVNRPVRDTARDTAAWFNQNRTEPPKVGWLAEQMAAAVQRTGK